MTRFALILLLAVAAPTAAQALEQGKNGDQTATEHRPPPGMCRIWINGVPAERQPAPTDCATAMRRRPSNARVIFGDEVRGTRVARPPVQQPTEPQINQQPSQQPNQPKTNEPRPNEPRQVDPNTNEPHPAQPRPQPRPPVRLPPRPVAKPHKPGGPPMSRIRIH
ncbi:MAG TPA: hypothetical protein VGR59_12370 [Gemmatimonadaceae bacterium]|nr:hypothetical protein [Gemmatimonadaceae bacterium]